MRIAIADDNELWMDSIVRALESRNVDVLVQARDPEELQHRFETIDASEIDCTILDLQFSPTVPDGGILCARKLRETYPEMGIILLSGYEENLQLHYAARTLTEISGRGGIGYLVKDRTSRDILFNALQRVNHGWLAVDTLFAIEAAERYRSQESARAKFNEREVRILDLLTQGYTNDQIADLIHHSKAVVERDLSSIFAKLGISGEGHSFRGENRRVLAVLEWLRRKGRLN